MSKNSILKNIFRALGSNALGILSSAFLILALPRFIGVEEYSYWQLYIFYASYVGLLHLGWSDGYYLSNGGKSYSQIDKFNTSSNYYAFVFFQLIIFLVIIALSFYLTGDYKDIVFYVAICLLITNIRSYSQFILQAVNRIKEYSLIIAAEKIFLVSGVILILLIDKVEYESIIIVDILSRLLALIISSVLCREVLYSASVSVENIKVGFSDAIRYISSGFKLMLSFFCGLMIFGVIRYTIESKWGILEFGEVSLALSLATLFVLFVNSISIVLFPVLKNVKPKYRRSVYVKIRFLIFIFLILLSNVYFPLEFFVSSWLSNYNKLLTYLPLVFPIMLFEVKISVLTNTFMKVLRKESKLLVVNFLLLILSVFSSVALYYLVDDIQFCLVVLVLLSAIRYFLFDYFLSKEMNVLDIKFWLFDMVFILLFVFFVYTERWYYYSVLTLPMAILLGYKVIKHRI
ncbi:hypothetical protein WB876_003928 [Vibrio vulnificus]